MLICSPFGILVVLKYWSMSHKKFSIYMVKCSLSKTNGSGTLILDLTPSLSLMSLLSTEMASFHMLKVAFHWDQPAIVSFTAATLVIHSFKTANVCIGASNLASSCWTLSTRETITFKESESRGWEVTHSFPPKAWKIAAMWSSRIETRHSHT